LWLSVLWLFVLWLSVRLPIHHPSHAITSCIHDIQVHLSQEWKKRRSRLLLLRFINIDNYFAFSIFKPSSNLFGLTCMSVGQKSHNIYIPWFMYRM
jgi:hypothetical protein